MAKRASVVVPSRGDSGHLRAALASALATTVDVEILVVLGPGAQPWPTVDPRVRMVSAEEPGPAPQRNAGVRHAVSGVVAFLDDDDVWLPGHLERALGVLDADRSVALVASNGRLFREPRPDGGSAIPDPSTLPAFLTLGPDRDVTFQELLAANAVLTPGVVARREALIVAGLFDPSFPAMEDWDLWLRVAAAGRIRLLADPSLVVRQRAASASRDLAAMASCALAVLDRVEAAGPPNPEVARVLAMRRAGLWHDLAHARIVAGDLRGARAALREAIRRDPLRAKNYVYWLMSLSGGLHAIRGRT